MLVTSVEGVDATAGLDGLSSEDVGEAIRTLHKDLRELRSNSQEGKMIV